MSNVAFTTAATTGTGLNGNSFSTVSANTVSNSIPGLSDYSVTDYLPENAVDIGSNLCISSNGELLVYCDKEKKNMGERDVKRETR